MDLQQKCFFVYLMIIQILALLAFLMGFFPIKAISSKNASIDDLPTTIQETRINPKYLYQKHIDKIILMVVDGLRYDFVDGEYSEKNMPYVYSLINKSDNCLLKVRVETPTVTMPRIKALMTGNIPGFLDIVLNFKSNEVVEDNILRQATKNGLFTIFYGDETWVNLFPNDFRRSETTTSFYVNDFYEVDDNVTRSLEKELNSFDWDIMILHYLGLDHIGHTEGPRSKFIKPKLNEMDGIIFKIHSYLVKKGTNNSKHENIILLVCGDHGMRDSGGHGGSSLTEVLVPFLFLNYGCDMYLRNEEINQIDFTPFISVLMGLPIPAGNLGKLDYKLLQNLDSLSRLYAMHYSTYSLKQIFDAYHFDVGINLEFLNNYQKAEHFFEMGMKSGFTNEIENVSLFHYFETQKFMSRKMIELSVNFDVYLMFISVLLLIQIWWILLKGYRLFFYVQRIVMAIFCFFVLTFLNYLCCYFFPGSSIMCSDVSVLKPVPSILSAIFSFNIFLVKRVNGTLKVPLGADLPLLFMFLLHLLSYASSSYIEEEHQFWYFFLTTICIYILISASAYSCIVILISHRVLQKLNQTGNKWAFLTDIGDWLNEEQNAIVLIFIYISGLSALIYWCSKNILGKHVTRWGLLLEKVLFMIEIVIIVIYRISVGNLKLPAVSLPQSRGILEVQLFWTCLIIQLFLYIVSFNFKNSKRKLMLNSLEISLIIAFEIVALLHKPHNIVLIPGMLYFLDVLTKYFCSNIYYLMALYQSVGMVYYFYQGNSNGLATIDIAAGFVGLEEFNLVVSGFFVFINTFSALILSNILLLRMVFLIERTEKQAYRCKHDVLYSVNSLPTWFPDMYLSAPQTFYTYAKNDALPKNVHQTERYFIPEVEYYWFTAIICCSYVIYYTVLVTIQRHHLFIWTVFSPKLLYMGCKLLLYGLFLLILLILELFQVIVDKLFNA